MFCWKPKALKKHSHGHIFRLLGPEPAVGESRIALGKCIKAEILGGVGNQPCCLSVTQGLMENGNSPESESLGLGPRNLNTNRCFRFLYEQKFEEHQRTKHYSQFHSCKIGIIPNFAKNLITPMQPEVPPQSVCIHNFQSHPSSALWLGDRKSLPRCWRQIPKHKTVEEFLQRDLTLHHLHPYFLKGNRSSRHHPASTFCNSKQVLKDQLPKREQGKFFELLR